jgi:hypothetical protein
MSNQNQNNLIALSVNNPVGQLVNDLFRDIDFSGIAQAIENIGNHSGSLTVEEKEYATDIVKQWESDVISRLNDKAHEMQVFLNFFEPARNGYLSNEDLFEEVGEELAKRTNTKNEYDAVVRIYKELRDLYDNRPEQPNFDENTTRKEQVEKEKAYEKEMAIYNMKVKHKERELYLADKKWKELLKQDKNVDELLKRARKFTKNLSKFKSMCHDKAQVAKLNIMVSQTNVRQALRELLNFSATI